MWKNNSRRRKPFEKRFLGPKGKKYTPRKFKPQNHEENGPAECKIPELEEFYFDYSGVSEADRYTTTKKAIQQYMGTKYGGDIRTTLEQGAIFNILVPDDPLDKYQDIKDQAGVVIKSAED